MSARKEEVHRMANEWFGLTPEQRFSQGMPITKEELRRKLKVQNKTLQGWEQRYNVKALRNRMEITLGGKEVPEEIYDSKIWLTERTNEVDEALLISVKRGNAQAIKIYKQLTGELVEKSEQKVTLELSADEIARRNLEADRGLKKWLKQGRTGRQGVEDLPEKPPLLPV